MAMTEASIESLLAEWHGWANSISNVMGLGYGRINHIAKMAKFSRARQHDDDLDDDIDHRAHEAEMRLVDKIIGNMHPTLKLAISVRAKNLWAGADVWTSPRLPRDKQELERVTREALSVFKRQWESQSA